MFSPHRALSRRGAIMRISIIDQTHFSAPIFSLTQGTFPVNFCISHCPWPIRGHTQESDRKKRKLVSSSEVDNSYFYILLKENAEPLLLHPLPFILLSGGTLGISPTSQQPDLINLGKKIVS